MGAVESLTPKIIGTSARNLFHSKMLLILICGLLFRKLALPAKKPCLTWAVGQVRLPLPLPLWVARLLLPISAKGCLIDCIRKRQSGGCFWKGERLDLVRTTFLLAILKHAPLHMSWEDDWANYGLGKGAVDVAVASRSVITHDLEDSLKKLSAVARERACVTVCTGVSPRVDARVARAMGLELERHNDALFVFGIASDLGYEPTVSYIHSARTKSYISPDEAYYSLLKTRDYLADTADQISVEESACRLRSFLADHLVEIDEDGAKRWTLDQPRVVPWAFISWDVGI